MDKWPGVGDKVKIIAPDAVPYAGQVGVVTDTDYHDAVEIGNAHYAIEFPDGAWRYFPGNYVQGVD